MTKLFATKERKERKCSVSHFTNDPHVLGMQHGSDERDTGAGAVAGLFLALRFLHLIDQIVVFGDDVVPVFHLIVELFHEFIALGDEVGDV